MSLRTWSRATTQICEGTSRHQPRGGEAVRLQPANYKVILSLRADFLADLESLRRRILPRAQPLPPPPDERGAGARPLSNLGDASSAKGLPNLSSASSPGQDSAEETTLAELEVDPALLSLFCRELNNKRGASPRSRQTWKAPRRTS
jgi:hypothetical protein